MKIKKYVVYLLLLQSLVTVGLANAMSDVTLTQIKEKMIVEKNAHFMRLTKNKHLCALVDQVEGKDVLVKLFEKKSGKKDDDTAIYVERTEDKKIKDNCYTKNFITKQNNTIDWYELKYFSYSSSSSSSSSDYEFFSDDEEDENNDLRDRAIIESASSSTSSSEEDEFLVGDTTIIINNNNVPAAPVPPIVPVVPPVAPVIPAVPVANNNNNTPINRFASNNIVDNTPSDVKIESAPPTPRDNNNTTASANRRTATNTSYAKNNYNKKQEGKFEYICRWLKKPSFWISSFTVVMVVSGVAYKMYKTKISKKRKKDNIDNVETDDEDNNNLLDQKHDNIDKNDEDPANLSVKKSLTYNK